MTDIERYPLETLDPDEDDGTMPERITTLAGAVVGHRITRLERDLAYYRMLPDDYPNGDDSEDIALRRARSWASLYPDTHAGVDQQLRACVTDVCDDLEFLRAATVKLRKQQSDVSWGLYLEPGC